MRKRPGARALILLVSLGACGRPPEPPAQSPAQTPREPAATTMTRASRPPPRDERCAAMHAAPNDNLRVVIDKVDPALGAALARAPADAAAEWASALGTLAASCREAKIDHALPSTRVTLSGPSECKPGAPTQKLTFDFGPEGSSDKLRVTGVVYMSSRAVTFDTRVQPSTDPTALCASGRFSLESSSSTSPDSPARAPSGAVPQSWLSVPFHLVGAVLGLAVPR